MLQDNNQNHGEGQQSFWKQLVTGIIDDQVAALRFAGVGAIIGGLAGAGLGVYLFGSFGWTGVGVCMLGGAIILGIAAWFLYLSF